MRNAALGILLVCTTVGCGAIVLGPGVRGSGVLKEESRSVGDFSAIEVGSACHVKLSIGPKTSVIISGDDNLLPLIKTEVNNGRLVVSETDPRGITRVKDLTLTITTPRLDTVIAHGAAKVEATAGDSKQFAINADGAANVNVTSLATESLTLDGSGASRITVAGKSKTLKLIASGATAADATRLAAESVEADLSGASHADVIATAGIKGDLSGASVLSVAGSPANRGVSTSGAASVNYQAPQPSK